MKANELMIGDWVYSTFCDKPCKVVGVEQYESGYANVKVTNVSGAKDINSLTPIPLTPEILEKNGFEKDYSSILTGEGFKKLPVYKYKNMKQAHDACHNLIKVCVSLDGSKYDVEFGIGSHIFDLEFVHQLQHALRLCGIEKEIVV